MLKLLFDTLISDDMAVSKFMQACLSKLSLHGHSIPVSKMQVYHCSCPYQQIIPMHQQLYPQADSDWNLQSQLFGLLPAPTLGQHQLNAQ